MFLKQYLLLIFVKKLLLSLICVIRQKEKSFVVVQVLKFK